MSRNTVLALVVAAVVAAAGIGWFVGSQIRSPAEVAAEAEPPEASNITVEVVRESLSADIITRGDIVFDDPLSLSLSGSFAQQPERLVVTQAVEVDTELAEGEVAVEVVGRPVFLLTGEIPMYRDLRPGASGDDVLQVEEALSRLGYFPGEPDETWDQMTGAAVAAWYEQAGYRPNGLSEEDEAALTAARDRVRAAEGAVADSEAALRDAQQGSGRSGVAAAEAELEAAQDDFELAKIDAGRANELARTAVTDAEAALADAETALAAARADLEAGETAEPPLGAEELAALRQAVVDAESAVTVAAQALDQAKFEVGRTEKEQEALVDAASRRIDVARAGLSDAQRGVDTSAMQRQIDSARQEVAAAREELAELEAGLGTWLPAGEVIFLSRLPVRVDQVSVPRGSIIESSFITVSGSELALRSSVLERDAPRVEEGMSVDIENPETGDPIPGVISLVADRAGTHNLAPDRVYVEVTPEEIPQEIVGANVKITIPVSSTGGDVLAVPAAALSATADGSTILQVEGADRTLRTVTVEPGLAAGGLVEVTPVEGELTEGDLVVVGLDQGGSATASNTASDAASDTDQ